MYICMSLSEAKQINFIFLKFLNFVTQVHE